MNSTDDKYVQCDIVKTDEIPFDMMYRFDMMYHDDDIHCYCSICGLRMLYCCGHVRKPELKMEIDIDKDEIQRVEFDVVSNKELKNAKLSIFDDNYDVKIVELNDKSVQTFNKSDPYYYRPSVLEICNKLLSEIRIQPSKFFENRDFPIQDLLKSKSPKERLKYLRSATFNIPNNEIKIVNRKRQREEDCENEYEDFEEGYEGESETDVSKYKE
jgi:hypothetical protein